jgi:lycopene cyclase domain-containing protein
VGHFQYLAVLVACVLVTLPLEFVVGARVWRNPRRLLRAVLPPWLAFVVWDVYATATDQWSFADEYTLPIRIPPGLAIEELLFFLVIPVCALLTLEAVRIMLRHEREHPERAR